jgi:hypothetical protein
MSGVVGTIPANTSARAIREHGRGACANDAFPSISRRLNTSPAVELTSRL